jgi:hypothetical protein
MAGHLRERIKDGSINIMSRRNIVLSGKVKAMAILKTRTHNERAEIDFELNYLASLTTQQRFDMMLRKSREMASLRKRHGSRRTTQIIKRT